MSRRGREAVALRGRVLRRGGFGRAFERAGEGGGGAREGIGGDGEGIEARRSWGDLGLSGECEGVRQQIAGDEDGRDSGVGESDGVYGQQSDRVVSQTGGCSRGCDGGGG